MDLKLRDKAVEKITAECEGKEYLIPFEEYLTSICCNDDTAEKMLDKNKTLEQCYIQMKEKARKRAKNGCGFFGPEEGFEIIREYYGIDLSIKKAEENVIDITDFL